MDALGSSDSVFPFFYVFFFLLKTKRLTAESRVQITGRFLSDAAINRWAIRLFVFACVCH